MLTTHPSTIVFEQFIVAMFDVSTVLVTVQFEVLVIWPFVLYPGTPTPEILTTAGVVKLESKLDDAVTSVVDPLSETAEIAAVAIWPLVSLASAEVCVKQSVAGMLFAWPPTFGSPPVTSGPIGGHAGVP